MKFKRFLFGVLTLILSIGLADAQQLNPTQELPIDPDVRIGKLDNGLTYYLRHNQKPAEMAEFYIFHNVGAIQEEDSQIGLAHFLEHMAFNGTTNLPGKQMITWLETIGVKFGANLNAATGVEMTFYNMSQVPLKRESIIDSALLVLHDWSHFIALKGDEIDNERGVIIEELRQGNNAGFRIREKTMPILFNGNKYSYRNIIGTEDQLRTFSHQEVRDFYHRWYRPDLQTIVIVGDFDVDIMEAKLKKVMADIPTPTNLQEKVMIPIPDNVEPLIAIETDPELTGSSISLYIKRPALPIQYNNTVGVLYINYLKSAALSMANSRISEILQKPNAPFLKAGFGDNPLSVTNDALAISASARDNEIPKAFEAVYTELEKVRRYGFSESEFERYKVNTLRWVEQSYESRADRRSDSFIWTYINNFRSNTSMMSSEDRFETTKMIVSMLNIDDINSFIAEMITPTNNVIIAMTPEKEGVTVPTERELLDIMVKVRNSEIQPYEDTVIDEPLISHKITPGKVVKTQKGVFESTVWTLKNGVKVVLKKTDFQSNMISMNAYANGGLSIIPDEDYLTASYVGSIVGMSGVGKLSNTELRKVLTGKVASAGPTLGRCSTGFNGSASKKDVETMLELTYLYFTQPRWNQDDFDRFTDMMRTNLANSQNTPNFKLQQEASKTLYGDIARAKSVTLETLSDIKFEKMPALYDKFFKNKASNYTFYFVGDFDINELKPLVEKYLGGLPAGKDKLSWKDDGHHVRSGKISNRFETEMQAPQTTVSYIYSGGIEYTQENDMVIKLLTSCLDTRYYEAIREEKGGTYGVSVSGSLSRLPKETYSLQVSFQTDPNMVDELVDIIEDEIRNIAENGPREKDMSKTLEYWAKNRPESLKNNSLWINSLQTYYTYNEDWNSNYDAIINSLDGKKVQALAQKIINDGNLIKLIMDPVK